MNPPLDYASLVRDYTNTAEGNDRLFALCTATTAAEPVLARHRAHVEEKKLGFGDPAFHALWDCLLGEAARRFPRVRALEIGVFKGQIISLWSLLARERELPIEVHALTPLAGNPAPPTSLWHRLRYRLDRGYRENFRTGNHYPAEDYESVVRQHYAWHDLNFDHVRLHRGYSTDPALLDALAGQDYEIIYVDGDHREAGARHDFRVFGAKVRPGGWLVADDAGYDLPGSGFWRGYPEVTAALAELTPLGFVNVLNVGHNRVFQRTRG